MKNKEIQKKAKELQTIMSNYKHELKGLEKDLYKAISDYRKALEEEKLKEIRDSLS